MTLLSSSCSGNHATDNQIFTDIWKQLNASFETLARSHQDATPHQAVRSQLNLHCDWTSSVKISLFKASMPVLDSNWKGELMA